MENSQHLQPTTLLISLDFDGCTDTPESREKLAEYIANHCKENRQYTEIIVAIGSLRQSIYTDILNAILNRRYFEGALLSASVLLTEFVEKLIAKIEENELTITVTPEPLLTSDIFNNLKPGDTFELMKASDYVEMIGIHKGRSIPVFDSKGRNISYYSIDELDDWLEKNINPLNEAEKERFLAQWCTNTEEFDDYIEYAKNTKIMKCHLKDTSEKLLSVLEITGPLVFSHGESFHYDDADKCLTLYILYQHVYLKHGKPFDSMHFDDRVDLLGIMETFYLSHHHLIPNQSSLINIEWNYDEKIFSPGKKIVGTGDANHDYQNDAKEIANLSIRFGRSSTQCIPIHFNKKKEEENRRHIVESYEQAGLTIFRPAPRRAAAPLSFSSETCQQISSK